jgi:hypothetical protein
MITHVGRPSYLDGAGAVPAPLLRMALKKSLEGSITMTSLRLRNVAR